MERLTRLTSDLNKRSEEGYLIAYLRDPGSFSLNVEDKVLLVCDDDDVEVTGKLMRMDFDAERGFRFYVKPTWWEPR